MTEQRGAVLDTLDNLHEIHRDKFLGFLEALKSNVVPFSDLAYYAWQTRRKYESSQADVQLQKRLRKAGK